MKKKVAIITVYKAGWKTVRQRWEKFFVEDDNCQYRFYHLEDYCKLINYITVKLDRFKTLWYITSGRAAVKAAIKDGCTDILINTFHYIPLIPIKKGVRYFVYGDATAIQVAAHQPRPYNRLSAEGKLPNSIDKIYKKGLSKLNKADVFHIGMSNWYLDSLVSDYGVPPEKTAKIPFGLDLNIWKPSEEKTFDPENPNILFVGAPFAMKGGKMLQELSELGEFANCRWHFVSYDAHFKSDDKRKYYTNITADTPQLLDIYRKCDIMLLPTTADCSPHVAIEAAAMGLAVIITDIGATSEIVADGESGYLVDFPPQKETFAAKLRKYINDPSNLQKHSNAARNKAVNDFDIEKHLQGIKSLIVRK
jgi:glycosyltransferase involved in cell wall biosynthesis